MTDETQGQEATQETMNNAQLPPTEPEVIPEQTAEGKVRRILGGEVITTAEAGGLQFQKMGELVDVAQLMARAGAYLPPFLRSNPGMCWATCLVAVEWGLSPLFVANHSYVTNDRIAYDSQLVHAVIESRAPLRERLRVSYEGEGDERTCTVTGWLRGENAPRELKSPPLKDLHPGYTLVRYEEGGAKGKRRLTYAQGQRMREAGELGENERLVPTGSPLWDTKRDLQLFYNTSRDWARMYCPREIGGIYTREEIAEMPAWERMRDVTPQTEALRERLAAAAETSTGDGFRDGVVAEAYGQETEELREALRKSVEIEEAPEAVRKGKAKTKAKAKAEAKPVSRIPANATDYAAYALKWMKAERSAVDLQARWARERSLRNKCGLTAEERAPLEKVKDKLVEKLQK